MRLIDADAMKANLGLMAASKSNADVILRNGYGQCWVPLSRFLQLIGEAPTIEAEPVRHGRWVPIYELTSEGILPDEPMGYMCDQCKAKRRKRLNYCSDCGAKMDGGEA